MASVGMLSFVSCIPYFSGIVELILFFHHVLINLLHLDPAQFAQFCTLHMGAQSPTKMKKKLIF